MNLTDKHRQILETSEQLFAVHGCEGTTVREIAKAAKINLAMVSYYFGSKEKLIESLFKYRTENTESNVEAVVSDANLEPLQKMERLVEGFIVNVFSKKDFYKIMMAEQMLNKNVRIIDFIKQLKLRYAVLFNQVIEEGLDKKHFTTNPDVVLLITSMTGTVIQMLINMKYYKEYYKLKDLKNDQLEELMKLRVGNYLKTSLKATLGYNEKPN